MLLARRILCFSLLVFLALLLLWETGSPRTGLALSSLQIDSLSNSLVHTVLLPAVVSLSGTRTELSIKAGAVTETKTNRAISDLFVGVYKSSCIKHSK